jgi:hypothetical protein
MEILEFYKMRETRNPPRRNHVRKHTPPKHQRRLHLFEALNAVIGFLKFKA